MVKKLQTMSGDARKENGRENSEFFFLVQRAAQGNRDALIDLCKTTVKGILFRTTRILGNQTDAEDVTQEVMVCVCSHIHELREPEAFYVWLNRIIMNETNRYMMKRSRHGVLLNIEDYQDDFVEANDEFLPQEYTMRESDRRAVIEIIDSLPGQQRKAVLLHYYDGLTLAESAKVMGVSQPRVSRCLKFAQEKIRKELTKQAGGAEGLAYGLAMLPLEPLLTQVLHHEAALFAHANIAWTSEFISSAATMAGAATVGVAGSVGASSGSTAAAANPIGPIATVVSAIVVSVGVLVGAPMMQAPEPPPVISTEYSISFSGGSSDHEYMNPKQAVAQAYSENGEMIALEWWITEEGDDSVLYSGDGGVVDEALAQMKTQGEYGNYLISFNMQDILGDSWTLSRKFTIET